MPVNAVVLFLGCQEAGKTKILYHCKLGALREVNRAAVSFDPTPAFNFERILRTHDGQRFQLHCWDLSGNPELRGMWRHYYSGTVPDAVAFVVDPFDKARLDEARDAFQVLLHEPNLQDTIKIVLVNIKATDDSAAPWKRIAMVKEKLGLPLSTTEAEEGSRGGVRVIEVNPGHENMGLNPFMNYLCQRLADR